MSNSDYNYSSDDEPVSKDHKKLLQAVGNLSKGQHIKKVARKEPSVNQNEFGLIKPRVQLPKQLLPTTTPVTVVDLVKTLTGTTKHLEVGKELKNVRNAGISLPRPLEKPEAERLIRTINYEKTKKQLERWDAVVAQFQSAEMQTFPLDSETVYIETTKFQKPLPLSMKSELQIAVEEAEAKLRALKGEKKDIPTDNDEHMKQILLTRQEIKKRRQELLYLKMRQSQKSSKMRMQNKIKSKKYHRLLKQHKVKEQLKEFELLQKQNPDEALKKLKSLEKNRILERANLRHKNTGTWAKNNLVKAKYNRDVQKDLSEQLALSRQLTEKKDTSDDEEEINSDDDATIYPANQSNPWIHLNNKKEDIKAMDTADNGYRKYWMSRNENEEKLKEARSEDSGVEEDNKDEIDKSLDASKSVKVMKNKKTTKKKAISTAVIENGWIVEDVQDVDTEANLQTIDKLFDNAEDVVLNELTQRQLKNKSHSAKRMKNLQKQRHPKRAKNELKNLQDLSFKNTSMRIEIDEHLLETASGENPVLPAATTAHRSPSKETVVNIKHDNYADVKPKSLKTSLAEITNCGEDLDFDDEEDTVTIDRQTTINDAFEDDDIVAEFGKQKNADEKNALAEKLTLSMPGWGSWAGTGISQNSNQAKKKLVLQFGNNTETDNGHKSRLRINENINKKLREHLVSEVPFPFTSVKDYEASIRAPLGRSFVPETAFRMLTKPAVITRRGQIIKPMDESELVRPVKRPRSVVEKRILYDSKVATQ